MSFFTGNDMHLTNFRVKYISNVFRDLSMIGAFTSESQMRLWCMSIYRATPHITWAKPSQIHIESENIVEKYGSPTIFPKKILV